MEVLDCMTFEKSSVPCASHTKPTEFFNSIGYQILFTVDVIFINILFMCVCPVFVKQNVFVSSIFWLGLIYGIRTPLILL